MGKSSRPLAEWALVQGKALGYEWSALPDLPSNAAMGQNPPASPPAADCRSGRSNPSSGSINSQKNPGTRDEIARLPQRDSSRCSSPARGGGGGAAAEPGRAGG